eukprot:6195994-Pleurochrysis_carterae.AAC.1
MASVMRSQPRQTNLAEVEEQDDDIVSQIFPEHYEPKANLFISQLAGVEYLGDTYEANVSWVVHERFLEKLAPSVAMIGRIIEASGDAGVNSCIFVQ